jgi:dolichyl-phosphate beta-glucosyltransferase
VADVALVIPCFNEERRLDVAAFTSFMEQEPRARFVFVDDGSTDGTRALLERLRDARPDRAAVVAQDRNVGKAEAVRLGFLAALEREPRYVGFWDADLATPLSELPRFIELLDERPELAMVFGARVKLLGRRIERHEWRHYLGRVFATAVSLMLRLPVYDTQCGAKLLRVDDVLRRTFAEPFVTRWLVDVEIIARYMNDRDVTRDVAEAIYELPLTRWSDVEGSKVRALDFVKAAGSLATIYRRYRT